MENTTPREPMEKVPRRCRWFGHKWGPNITPEQRIRNYQCERCLRFKAPCDNCGDVHNPDSITICSVTRKVQW